MTQLKEKALSEGMDFRKPALNSNTIRQNGFTRHAPWSWANHLFLPPSPFPFSPLRSSSSLQFALGWMRTPEQHRERRHSPAPARAATAHVTVTNHRTAEGADPMGHLWHHYGNSGTNCNRTTREYFARKSTTVRGGKRQKMLDNLFTRNNSSNSNT